MFAHKNPPRGQHETMTAKDPLDYVDFVEVGVFAFLRAFLGLCVCIPKSCSLEVCLLPLFLWMLA